jgi:hypothetical protein
MSAPVLSRDSARATEEDLARSLRSFRNQLANDGTPHDTAQNRRGDTQLATIRSARRVLRPTTSSPFRRFAISTPH